MKIEYGTIEFFRLEHLQKELNSTKYEKLGLVYLDKLKLEVNTKVAAANRIHKEKLKNEPAKDIWDF